MGLIINKSIILSLIVSSREDRAKLGVGDAQDADWRRGAPHGLRLTVDNTFVSAMNELVADVHPQLLLIAHVYMAQYRQFVGDIPVFVTCHNVETTKISRWYESTKTPTLGCLRQHLQVLAMRRLESSLGYLEALTANV